MALPSIIGGVSKLFGGGNKEENASNAEFNKFLQQIMGSQVADPSKQARSAVRGDMWKAFADPAMREMMGGAAFNAIGSTNPNILGVNKTAADFAGDFQSQRKETQQSGFLDKIGPLAGILGGAAMSGIGGGTGPMAPMGMPGGAAGGQLGADMGGLSFDPRQLRLE
jgi:hypothetical protein